MKKDFNRKGDPEYQKSGLRGRVEDGVKPLYDSAGELEERHAKQLPVIPVTGGGRPHKYQDNKSYERF